MAAASRKAGRSRSGTPTHSAILTEVGGTVSWRDLIEGVTVHEEVDEVTGLSRPIVMDSPDEKRQPRIELKSATRQGAQSLSDARPGKPYGHEW